MQCRSLGLTLRTWGTILNVRKLKHTWISTLSLSFVIVRLEIFCKFHDNDTVNSHYNDKTAILLFLRAFKNSFLSNFDCFGISVLTRWNYSLLFQVNLWSSWLRLYGPRQWQLLSWHMKFLKCTVPFHITYELGQMMEIHLEMHPRTIRIGKFHTKTVSILLFLIFEKCWFCENYPLTKSLGFIFMDRSDHGLSKILKSLLLSGDWRAPKYSF